MWALSQASSSEGCSACAAAKGGPSEGCQKALSSFSVFPYCLLQLSFLGTICFCSPQFPFRAWELHFGKGWCLYLEQYAARVLGEVARLLGSVITSHHPHPPEPRALCPRISMSHISAHPTSWSVLWVTCHHCARQMGHLGRE